jgi:transcription termination factor NusB
MDNIFDPDSSWEEVKEKIKEVHLDITDADLDFKPGKEDELFERLALKFHKNKQEIKNWIESISSNKTIAG